jgi:hypothetical protein
MSAPPKSRRSLGARPKHRRQIRLRTGPSQLKTNIEIKHQFRFTSTSAALTGVKAPNIIAAAGVVATTASLGYSVNQMMKVNRIEVWTPPPSQGASVTCSILFPATNQSQPREVTDTSVSTAVPAHIVAVPPPNSLCGFWNGGNVATVLFSLVAPPGSIIDLWISAVLNDGTAVGASQTQAVLVGATVGSLYYCSLDSVVSAGSIYLPVGLTTL